MSNPEGSRVLPDVTIRVEETSPGFFVAGFHPNSPDRHLARSGFTVDTTAGAQGHTVDEVLDWAEDHWRLNYPLEPGPMDDLAN
jgi:hypothetical protein